jgi:hypothetical protein
VTTNEATGALGSGWEEGLRFRRRQPPAGCNYVTRSNSRLASVYPEVRARLNGFRGLFLKGVGPSVLWPQVLALAVMGFLTLWLAAKRFHKALA